MWIILKVDFRMRTHKCYYTLQIFFSSYKWLMYNGEHEHGWNKKKWRTLEVITKSIIFLSVWWYYKHTWMLVQIGNGGKIKRVSNWRIACIILHLCNMIWTKSRKSKVKGGRFVIHWNQSRNKITARHQSVPGTGAINLTLSYLGQSPTCPSPATTAAELKTELEPESEPPMHKKFF